MGVEVREGTVDEVEKGAVACLEGRAESEADCASVIGIGKMA